MKKKNKPRFINLTQSQLYEIFNENTKIPFFSKRKISREALLLFTKPHYKSYGRFKQIVLSHEFPKRSISIEKAILSRKSEREFTGKDLSLRELSKILFYSAGIIDKTEGKIRRAWPSAGARYPLELYPIILRCRKIKKGIYHYNVKPHSLETIKLGDFTTKLKNLTDQEWIKKAGMIILISAIFKRTTMKYGNRGYRYIFLDAGHLAQNIYLITSAMNLGCCTIGGFLDHDLSELLNIDGFYESVIYAVGIGKVNNK